MQPNGILVTCLALISVFQGALLSLLAFRVILHGEKTHELLKSYVFAAHDTIERLSEKVHGDILTLRGHHSERSLRTSLTPPLSPGAPVVQYPGIDLVDVDQPGDLGGGPHLVGASRG